MLSSMRTARVECTVYICTIGTTPSIISLCLQRAIYLPLIAEIKGIWGGRDGQVVKAKGLIRDDRRQAVGGK